MASTTEKEKTVTITTRISGSIARAWARASLDRKEKGADSAVTKEGIVNEALHQWLSRHGYEV